MPVKHWFKSGGTQDAALYLHYQQAGCRKPRQLCMAGWGCYDLVNISEKLIIAQTINSWRSTIEGRSTVAENC